MGALRLSPVAHRKPPTSATLGTRAQLRWGAFSSVSQMFLLLSQPPCPRLPLTALRCGCSVMKRLFGAWTARPGSSPGPAQVGTAKSSGSNPGSNHLWVHWRDLQVKRSPPALSLNLRALGLAQRCHISEGMRGHISAGEACAGSYVGCSAPGCPGGKGDAERNIRTELPDKPAGRRVQPPRWGLPPSTSSYKKGQLGKSSPLRPEPFLAGQRCFAPMWSHVQWPQARGWDLLGCADRTHHPPSCETRLRTPVAVGSMHVWGLWV